METDLLMELSHKRPILFYDGYCKLCNWAVRLVLNYEHSKTVLFSSLTSPSGVSMKTYYEAEKGKLPDSIVWMEGGRIFIYSDVILKIIPHLKWYLKWLMIIGILPVTMRNNLYRWVARNRYKWFGKYDTCPLPDKETIERFIV